jgi:hypothetical protein
MKAIQVLADCRMRSQTWFLAMALCVTGQFARAEDFPTAQQVEQWWKTNSSDEMSLDGPLQEVHLINRETAYIAPATLSPRGRNGMFRAVLVRPDIKEVRELPEPVGNHLTVLDLEGDGISEVLSVLVTSGGGQTDTDHSIFRLDGFTPVVLHEAIEEDNFGDCPPQECAGVAIDWKFGRTTSSGPTTLTETVTFSRGPREDRLKRKTEVRRYVLIGNFFARADAPSLR